MVKIYRKLSFDMKEKQIPTLLPQILAHLEEADRALMAARELISRTEITKKGQEILSETKQGKEMPSKNGDNILEGTFDGECFVSADERRFPVPANYASKSKLVASDILKLTIEEDGSYVYKQILPVERKRAIGELISESGKYCLLVNGQKLNVLLASVTFYKGKTGDKFSVLVPEGVPATWATIENKVE